MRTAALIALGGALGSVGRWLVQGLAHRIAPHSAFPWGTLAVNVIGSFGIGLVMSLALERNVVSPTARFFLVTGVLGGFTTFSAFSWEALVLAREGQWAAAIAYTGGSLLAGLAAALAGVAVALRN